MEQQIIECKVITPMFCGGGNPKTSELRASEVKGLMRYTFRMIQQNISVKKLYEEEIKYFGDTQTQASPVRLQMKYMPDDDHTYKIHTVKNRLLYHKRKYTNDDDPECIPNNTSFNIIVRLRKSAKYDGEKFQNIRHYCDFIKLSLLLGGIGKRSRRTRGAVEICELHKNEICIKNWICDHLNFFSLSGNDTYKINPDNRNEITVRSGLVKEKPSRPVIEKIIFGELRKFNKSNENRVIEKFLTDVDNASHDIKCSDNFGGKYHHPFATGNYKTKKRFASSIIVSIIKTSEGFLPVYTYLHALFDKDHLDSNYEERNDFREMIEMRCGKK